MSVLPGHGANGGRRPAVSKPGMFETVGGALSAGAFFVVLWVLVAFTAGVAARAATELFELGWGLVG